MVDFTVSRSEVLEDFSMAVLATNTIHKDETYAAITQTSWEVSREWGCSTIARSHIFYFGSTFTQCTLSLGSVRTNPIFSLSPRRRLSLSRIQNVEFPHSFPRYFTW